MKQDDLDRPENDNESQNEITDKDNLVVPPSADQNNEEFDFDRMDKDVAEFRRKIQSIEPNVDNNSAEDFDHFGADYTPMRRRRRPIRMQDNPKEITEQLGGILDRSNPNLDFFLLSVLCGVVIGVGYAIDSNAILMFGIFVAPFLGPLVGSVLTAILGDSTTLKQTGGAFLTGLALTLLTTTLVGGITRFFPGNNAIQAYYHSHLWWPDIFLAIVGSVILILRFTQSESRPIIPGLMVAYALYLPLGVAGFGLGSGITDLWPQGLFVFLAHLSITLLISLTIFIYMGVRPANKLGLALAGSIALISLFVLAFFGGLGNLLPAGSSAPSQLQPVVTSEPTLLPSVSENTPTATQLAVPTTTPRPHTPTVSPAQTSESTITPMGSLPMTGVPTAIFGRVLSTESDGVVVRDSPGGITITTVLNDYLVQILDDQPVVNEQGTWIHVIIKDQTADIQGWVISAYIITATPSFTP